MSAKSIAATCGRAGLRAGGFTVGMVPYTGKVVLFTTGTGLEALAALCHAGANLSFQGADWCQSMVDKVDAKVADACLELDAWEMGVPVEGLPEVVMEDGDPIEAAVNKAIKMISDSGGNLTMELLDKIANHVMQGLNTEQQAQVGRRLELFLNSVVGAAPAPEPPKPPAPPAPPKPKAPKNPPKTAGAKVEPKVEATAKAEVEAKVEPKVEATAKAEVEAKVEPKAEEEPCCPICKKKGKGSSRAAKARSLGNHNRQCYLEMLTAQKWDVNTKVDVIEAYLVTRDLKLDADRFNKLVGSIQKQIKDIAKRTAKKAAAKTEPKVELPAPKPATTPANPSLSTGVFHTPPPRRAAAAV